jgi:hypothetical protein
MSKVDLMRRFLAVVLGLTLAALGLAGPASAFTPKLPVSKALTTVPASVSWPDSRNFSYRLDVTAGPDGSHFVFTVPMPVFTFPGVSGSPFSYSAQPTLDGPGTIKPIFALVSDPVPWACWRGAFTGNQSWYEVTLDPGVETTIVAPARLEAAPLAGMATETDFRIENGDDPVLIPANVEVGGKPGIRIRTVVPGADPHLLVDRKPNQAFRLRGYTRPALPNRKIRFRADPTPGPGGNAPSDSFPLVTLKTDSKGNFRSKQLRVESKGIWRVTSRLAYPGRFAQENNCGPTLNVTSKRTGSEIAR